MKSIFLLILLLFAVGALAADPRPCPWPLKASPTTPSTRC